MVVQLKVGEEQRLPFSLRSLNGMHDGVADFDVRTSTLHALSPGFTGFVLRTSTEEKRFIYVEVSAGNPGPPRTSPP
jgi:hypothetical protein